MATALAVCTTTTVMAQAETGTPPSCRPVSTGGQEQSSATRSPEIAAACATSAAIIEAAVAARGGTPGASPAAEPAGTPAGSAADEPTGELATRLPPADLPSTNEQGYSYELEASLTADLNRTQEEAPVYRLVPDDVTADGVAEMASRLDLTGTVQERGDGVYVVSGGGDLFVTSTIVQYIAPPSSSGGELPSDEDAVLAARDWLQGTGLAPADLGAGELLASARETGRLLVQFAPLEPERLLAAYPSAVVTIGEGGTVVEARLQWPTIERFDLYLLRDSESAWRDVEAGRAYIEAPLEGADIEQGSRIEGNVVYDTIDIGYTTSGPPDGVQFLQPIYIFSGQLTLEGSSRSYPVSAYVPGLVSSRTPVG
ncbi:MAG: hypothetical protein ACR2LS_07500 [Thermomicrobiales bacterium]